MLEGELEDVLWGLVGIGRGQGGDVEGLAHQAVSILAVALCARNGVMVTKNRGLDGLISAAPGSRARPLPQVQRTSARLRIPCGSGRAREESTIDHKPCSVCINTRTLAIDSSYSACHSESATTAPPPQQLACPSLTSRLRMA